MKKASELITVRLTPEHKNSCTNLPPPVTSSVLARVLFSAYFEHRLPAWIYNEILVEARRAQAAKKQGSFKPGHKPWNLGETTKCQNQKQTAQTPQVLKFKLQPPPQQMSSE